MTKPRNSQQSAPGSRVSRRWRQGWNPGPPPGLSSSSPRLTCTQPCSPGPAPRRSPELLAPPTHPCAPPPQMPGRCNPESGAEAQDGAQHRHSRACVAPIGIQEHLPVIHHHHVPQRDQGGLRAAATVSRRGWEAGRGGGPGGQGVTGSPQSHRSCWPSTPAARSSHRALSHCQGLGWGSGQLGQRQSWTHTPSCLALSAPRRARSRLAPRKRGRRRASTSSCGGRQEARAVDTPEKQREEPSGSPRAAVTTCTAPLCQHGARPPGPDGGV